jgi:hypothetical protein
MGNAEVAAFLVICFLAGLAVGAKSGLGVWICLVAAYLLGRLHG